MSSIYEVPYCDIVEFLERNNKYIPEDNNKVYDIAFELLKDKKSKGHTVSLIEWMKAYNLLSNNVEIPIYNINKIKKMKTYEIDDLAKLLKMKGNNVNNIINILRYLHKLDETPEKVPVNKTLKNVTAGKQFKNVLINKYDNDKIIDIILKSDNINLLKNLYESDAKTILDDPTILKLLIGRFNLKSEGINNFLDLWNKKAQEGSPEIFNIGAKPSLVNMSRNYPEVKFKWNLINKNNWIDKLEIVQESNNINKLSTEIYINNGILDYIEYGSKDGVVIWNNLCSSFINNDEYLPSEELFLFINTEYNNISESEKRRLFREVFGTKTRY